MSKHKILIVEDEPVIAENISYYLNNSDFEVSAIAYDTDEALHQLLHNTPDAVLLDINLDSELDGINIAETINKNYQLPFLFLTSYSDKNTLERAKHVKPSGYIVKPFNERTILASLEIAISNFTTQKNHQLPPLSLEKINRQLIAHLSDREFEITQLMYEGITNSQIADRIFVSMNTVKTHLKNIHLKLEASTRLQVIKKLREFMLK